jgi:HAD superfamily hydrolase (TIGR01509 family)
MEQRCSGGKAEAPALLIFDCDGVLVDSEVMSAEIVVNVLRRHGLEIDLARVYRDFLGRSMESLRAAVLHENGFEIGAAELDELRSEMQVRIRRELRSIPGTFRAISQLPAARCVASSSRPERIRLSLEATGLLELFEPNIFSATMVSSGKPAPDLFLLAARSMGFRPADCIVIEDSPAGVEAAKNAGMRVVAFVGGSHAAPSGLQDKLAQIGPDAIFDDMQRLPELLAEVSGLN